MRRPRRVAEPLEERYAAFAKAALQAKAKQGEKDLAARGEGRAGGGGRGARARCSRRSARLSSASASAPKAALKDLKAEVLRLRSASRRCSTPSAAWRSRPRRRRSARARRSARGRRSGGARASARPRSARASSGGRCARRRCRTRRRRPRARHGRLAGGDAAAAKAAPRNRASACTPAGTAARALGPTVRGGFGDDADAAATAALLVANAGPKISGSPLKGKAPLGAIPSGNAPAQPVAPAFASSPKLAAASPGKMSVASADAYGDDDFEDDFEEDIDD